MKQSTISTSIAVVAALMLALYGCGNRNENADNKAGEQPRGERVILTRQSLREIGLQVVSVEFRSLNRELIVASKLVANQDYEAQVGTFVSGRVSRVLVNLGDHVRQGQALMQIEGVEVGEIKSRFIKAKAQYEYAETSLKRQQSLLSQNVGSQKAVLEAQAEFEKARAEFIAEDRRIHSVGLTDAEVERFVQHSAGDSSESHIGGFLPIKSPIEGIIVERNVVIGQPVDQTTMAFKVLNTTTLWVDGQVHEGDVSILRGEPQIAVVIPAVSREPIRGRLLYIGELIDQQTRMVKVRAALPNPQRRFKPEMFAEMRVTAGGTTRGLSVRVESVVMEGSEHYVFVALNDTTFEKRDVVSGTAIGEWMEIVRGLRVGEKVVSNGAFMLKSELKKEKFGEGD